MGSNGNGSSNGYAGLLEQAHARGLKSLCVEILSFPLEQNEGHAVVKVKASFDSGAFYALGEARQSDSSTGFLLELAESRAKMRVLADALGIVVKATKPELQPVPTTGRSSSPSNGNGSHGSGSNGNGAKPQPAYRENSSGITSAQQRFLFRLMVEHGVQAKQAKDALCELGQVNYVNELTKHQASELIQGLQSGQIQVPSQFVSA